MLTDYELHQDCLCYLKYKGQRVKASRLFAGNEHEQQTKCLAEHFNKPAEYYQTVKYDSSVSKKRQRNNASHEVNDVHAMVQQSSFKERDLKKLQTYEQAYHQLMSDIMHQQVRSLKLVLQNNKVKKIFVDGGFSKNDVYMNLLADSFPKMEVYAARVSHASSLGAALIMHEHWNKNPLPDNLVELKKYSVR
jgi:activator of 2-hydroxyglutaryl-CoA dehydratase